MGEILKVANENHCNLSKDVLKDYFYIYDKKNFSLKIPRLFMEYNKKDMTVSITKSNKTLRPTKINTATFTEEREGKKYLISIVTEEGANFQLQCFNENIFKAWRHEIEDDPQTNLNETTESTSNDLDEYSLSIVNYLIAAIENRGLTNEGMYRVDGLKTRIEDLLIEIRTPKTLSSIDNVKNYALEDLTSTLKNYLRYKSEPLLMFKLYNNFIQTAKIEDKQDKINEVKNLINELDPINYTISQKLIKHLTNVTVVSDKNCMTASNLSICFGPTLLYPKHIKLSSIIDIKFANIIIQCLIENYDFIFDKETRPPISPASRSNPNTQKKLNFDEIIYNSLQVVDRNVEVLPIASSPRTPKYIAKRGPPVPAFNDLMKSSVFRNSIRIKVPTTQKSTTVTQEKNIKVLTIYDCFADEEGELSFVTGEILNNVCQSGEDGWIYATNNKNTTGLVPENYVKYI
ncbi:Beta-chimaerin [Intoshia linei]|uniref:Beta-chimaerin n=1 Tax=Intoshia linei TaxID=1819745 RepID=A0A177AZP3_9BILA|nr:Beta-chimaerin [Intoshia linei]